MRITLHDHGGKGCRLAEALRAAGHETVAAGGDLALVSHDFLADICDAHEVVVLYPHGGGPVLSWDGQAPHPHVRVALVHAPGVAEVMDAYGWSVPTKVIGWDYCNLAAPRYPDTVRRVLFAPIHPLDNGYLPASAAEANRLTLALLLASDCEVTVRSYGAPSGHGLDPEAPVRWVTGGTLDTADLDAADLVVSCGTVLHLALARGVPAVAMVSDVLPDVGHGEPHFPPGWDAYRHLMRYPYDVLDAPLVDLFAAVTRPNSAVEDYRARFVGQPFDPARAVALIESSIL